MTNRNRENTFQIADPYRWLEDPYSEETRKYADAEDKVAREYLENNDLRPKINAKLTKVWNYSKCSVPVHCGDYYFTNRNTGLQNQE